MKSKRILLREEAEKMAKEITAKSVWQEAEIELDMSWEDEKGNTKLDEMRFNIVHNLPNVHGMSLQDALENWKVRTEVHTDKSLCDYINSKTHMTGCMAFTMKEYKEMSGGLKPPRTDPPMDIN